MSDEFKTQRIVYYDFIRTFAIIGVIACHCFARYVVNTDIFSTNLWYYAMFLNSFRDLCVPLFVCVSGALLITKKDSISLFIKKRFKKVIIPFIFWVAVFILSKICIMQPESWGKFIINTLSIPPVGTGVFFWFVQMIVVVYAVIIILNRLIKFNRGFLNLFMLLGVIYIILFNLNIIPNISKPYVYVCYSFFAVLGFYLANCDLTRNRLAESLKINDEKLAVVFLVASIALYLVEVYFNVVHSIALNKHSAVSQFDFINVFLVISVFLFFRYFAESRGKMNGICRYMLGNNIGKVIFSISFCSYGIYLSHVMVRNGLNYLFYNVKSIPTSVNLTLVFVLTLIISWVMILMMSKIPILEKVSGR